MSDTPAPILPVKKDAGPEPEPLLATARLRRVTANGLWDIMLITVWAVTFGVGMNGIAMQHGFISGGFFGTGLLIWYATDWLSPSAWYLLFNIPLLAIAARMLSLRFVAFSVYGVFITFLATRYIHWTAPIYDPLLASVAAGLICGAGYGVLLWSRGSDGGTTILGIMLHLKWNLRVGQVNILFNLALFLVCLFSMNVEAVLYSMIFVFSYSTVADQVHGMFNQRKLVLIISEHSEQIAREVLTRLQRGVTLLEGRGAFTGRKREVVMTVVQNYQSKHLEDVVYEIDPKAFMIIENTFNVLGQGFSKRKKY